MDKLSMTFTKERATDSRHLDLLTAPNSKRTQIWERHGMRQRAVTYEGTCLPLINIKNIIILSLEEWVKEALRRTAMFGTYVLACHFSTGGHHLLVIRYLRNCEEILYQPQLLQCRH